MSSHQINEEDASLDDASMPDGADNSSGDLPLNKLGRQALTETASKAPPSTLFLVVLTAINVVADLWSKGWAKTHFETAAPGEREVVIIPELMNFIYAQNRGGAWGFLQSETESLRRPFFLVVSVAAIVFIVTLYRKLEPEQWILKWGLPMVLGGALGNFVDRVRYGFVVDFIDVWVKVEEGSFLSKFMDLGESHWPTFNIADVSICIGVGLMAVDMFVGQGSQGEADEKPDKESESDAAENDSPRASELTETEVDTESPSSALIASEAGAASDAAPVVVDPSDASEAPAEGA